MSELFDYGRLQYFTRLFEDLQNFCIRILSKSDPLPSRNILKQSGIFLENKFHEIIEITCIEGNISFLLAFHLLPLFLVLLHKKS